MKIIKPDPDPKRSFNKICLVDLYFIKNQFLTILTSQIELNKYKSQIKLPTI